MTTLYSKFENLTEEKRKKIIEVCIEEFAQNGYENASTNSIVKKSEISKGILFHYFGNKKNLYLYILSYSTDFMMEYVMEKYAENHIGRKEDPFDKIMHMGLIKIRMAYEFPSLYKLVLGAFTHTPAGVQKEIQASYNKVYREGMAMLFKEIDTSRFREGINKDKALELILFSLEGVSNKYLKMYKNIPEDRILTEIEAIIQEYTEYIEILKGGIYGGL